MPLSRKSSAAVNSSGARGAAHGGNAAIVAGGQFLQRSALRAPSGGLFDCCVPWSGVGAVGK
jgi:hypothetical protein